MMAFDRAYDGRRVLITGHTGFKGSWLALWLSLLGARVSALALPPPTNPNHWDRLALPVKELRHDIRDAGAVARFVASVRPDIVFHLAAQPLVRASYADPLTTWSTNVMGTANLLDACRHTDSVRAIVVVTSDKCYDNPETAHAFSEGDRLGGHDPYSASKAATELVAASYRSAFFSHARAPLLATARAGNVIGGGDWSADRLIPDLVRAVSAGAALEIRSPHATRPWQHVLDCLSGYLLLGQRLLEGDARCADAWNFGPGAGGNKTVAEILDMIRTRWPALQWHCATAPQPHEATLLQLDSGKARSALGWKPVWEIDAALDATVDWYRADAGQAVSRAQIEGYARDAHAAGLPWSAR